MQEQKVGSMQVATGFIAAYAATIYPFMRTNIGKNHPGLAGLIGMGWVVLWVAHTHADGLILLVPLYLGGQLLHSLQHAFKQSTVHTRYSGTPVLAMKLLRFKDEIAAKRFGEPVISLIVGLGLLRLGYDEGKYFALGAVVLFMNQSLVGQYERRRVDDMRDGMIGSSYLMSQLRSRRRF
jgi:hypothetical protein